ncbi:MAG TPA: T9SS type A sorting domain-containing protein, partial [Bacteroidia bacterium]|nr:T9SS type A sorting domain-containing protein [Bacteroidia bacterium]
STTYSIAPTSNTTGYNWSVPSGFSITSATNTNVISVSTTTATTSGAVSVYAVNNNGCGNGASSNLNVQVDQQPADPNAGPDQPLVCIGNAYLNATAVTSPDAGQWSWLSGTPVPSIGTTTVNSTSISGLTSSNTYQYVWTVTRAGSICPSKTDTVSITTNWASPTCQPAAVFSYGPNSDVSNNSVCLGSVTNFNDLSISADSWQWDFTYNGSSPVYTSTLQNPSYTYPSAGTYTVYLRIYSNATTQYYSTTQVINVIDAPAAPTTIFGTTGNICAGSSSQYVYSISSVTNATSYNWAVPGGAFIAANPSPTSIATTFSTNAVSGNVQVSAANSCGTSTATTLSVTVNPLPDAAGTINGSATVCQGQTNVTYSVPAIANATNYIWTDINGNQTTIAAPSTTYSFSTSATNGVISVQGSNACGVGVVSTLPVTVNPLPDAAGAIIGLSNVNLCPNPDTLVYVVPTVNNATSYNWTFPTGVTVVGGNAMDTMKVTISIAAAGNQLISVYGSNACGNGATANANLQVNIPSTPQICMVTVDSLSTHNIIYWDKTTVTGADSFRIYRENSTNVYTQIGTVSYNSLSEYHDFGVDPNATTTRYKISAIDSCGNESAKSNYHNTIYIVNVGGGQYTWNPLYTIENSPNPVTQYVLMRDDNNTGVFNQILTTSGTSNTLNDVNYASYPNANWYVDALGFNCNPTLRLSNGGNSTYAAKIRSHSNQNNNRQSGINKFNANAGDVTVYPNPSAGNFTVSNSQKIDELKVTDVLGNLVYETKPGDYSASLHLENAGVYFITVVSGKQTTIKKVVVNN